MNGLDVFTARDLRNNVGGLIKDATNGELSLITKHGKPTAITLPFNKELLSLGINRALATKLYELKLATFSQAAKIANLSVYEFMDILKETDIVSVDYPEDELEKEVELFDE